MFEVKTASIEVEGKTITLETGRLAKQANGAVLVSCGESSVLVTATSGNLSPMRRFSH
jgi:polyribonucleotide nucleotidyltransferase